MFSERPSIQDAPPGVLLTRTIYPSSRWPARFYAPHLHASPTGFEPAPPTLTRWCSTVELRTLDLPIPLRGCRLLSPGWNRLSIAARILYLGSTAEVVPKPLWSRARSGIQRRTAGRIRTCIYPLRRRVPRPFEPQRHCVPAPGIEPGTTSLSEKRTAVVLDRETFQRQALQPFSSAASSWQLLHSMPSQLGQLSAHGSQTLLPQPAQSIISSSAALMPQLAQGSSSTVAS